MLAIMDGTKSRPQGVMWSGLVGSSSWFGNAISPDIAYSIVLEGMQRTKYAIYFMSDNMDNSGDVHIGPFTTRGFVTWLRDHDLGAIQTCGPVISLRTRRNIQGWIFVPHWDLCTTRIIKDRARLIKLYKGYNNDPKIKEAQQERCKEQHEASRTISAALSSGWSGRSFSRHYTNDR